MQQSSLKTLVIITRRKLICQQVSLIVMSVDISCSTFIPSSALPHHMIGDNVTLILQSRVRDNGI